MCIWVIFLNLYVSVYFLLNELAYQSYNSAYYKHNENLQFWVWPVKKSTATSSIEYCVTLNVKYRKTMQYYVWMIHDFHY
jgi:hypothetical protein